MRAPPRAAAAFQTEVPMSKLSRLILLPLAALFALLPLSACTEEKEDGVTLIRVNEVTHSVFYAPMYLADSLGYFEEENIEIELTNGGGADKVMAAVLSGDADIGFCGPEAAIYVLLGGTTDVPTVFGQLTRRDGSFLVSRTDEPDFSWEDLAGKEVLAGRKGGVPAMTFEYILKEYDYNEALFYLDPPYVGTENYYKNTGGFGLKEHELLCNLLKNIKGKFMLSYNDCELIRELYKDFNIKELKVRYSLNNNVLKRKESKELLIMNF